MTYAHLLPILGYLPRYAFSRRAGWLPPDSIPLADYLLLRRVAMECADEPIPYVALKTNALNPYRTIDPLLDGLPQLVRWNLLEQDRDAYILTPTGHDLLTRGERAANDYATSRMHLLPEPLAHLATTLHDIAESLRLAPEPAIRTHQDRVPFLRRFDPRLSPPIQLEYAMYSLQRARDDAHIAAWRGAGLNGPEVDLLSTLWDSEATTDDTLVNLYRHRMRPGDVSMLLAELGRKGYVAIGTGTVRISDAGRVVRTSIEQETNRLYFSPWPSIDTGWMFDQLETLLANLGSRGNSFTNITA